MMMKTFSTAAGDSCAPRRKRQGGFILVTHAIMITSTVAMVGLAIDAGTLYLVKSRLSAAVDAAALAAGRSVNLANNVAQANVAATSMANQFFAANFPSGYLGVQGAPTVTPTFTQQLDGSGNPNGVLDIAVSASVVAPTYFMHIFNVNNVTINASGTATRRGLVMMLVLDISSSMNTSTSPTACQAMVSASRNFIRQFSPYDRVGAVTFDYTAHLIYPPSTTFLDGSLDAALANVTCNNNTNTTSGLEMAYQQVVAQNLRLAENTIILFTDGSPNGISANFPVRTQVDTRWGPAAGSPTPPAQSGSTYGQANSCASGANGGNNGICVNMPVLCTGGATVRGTIAQQSGQNSYGGGTGGMFLPMDSDSAIVYPPGCSGATGSLTRQMIAYIPNTDVYGNSTHGVVATGPGPTVSNSGPSNGRLTRDLWLYQVNSLCSPDPTIVPNCKNVGGLWSANNTIGSASNFFTSGPYSNFLRPDQPNTIVAASMNTAMDEALRIRSNATYHIVINTIYLTGNGGDAVDREFLPVIANVPSIPALPYDPVSYTPYSNAAYQSLQPRGQYLVTARSSQLTALFAQLASEVLRLSQ